MNADGSNPTMLTSDDPFSPQAVRQVFHLAWSPDGTKIAFTLGDNIHVMDADGSNHVQLTESGNINLDGADWSPDGSKLVFVSNPAGGIYDSDIYVAEFEGISP